MLLSVLHTHNWKVYKNLMSLTKTTSWQLKKQIFFSRLLCLQDYPRYGFNYAINDPITKDNKAQWEVRDGDVINGAYSLREPDGTIRVVEYSANDIKGFNAVVKKIGSNVHPISIVTKTIHGKGPIKAKAPVKAAPVVEITPVSISTVHNSGPKNTITSNYNYGFGAAALAIGLPKVTSLGHWSLPWDPATRSYGGWVPLKGPVAQGPYATVFSKKYINGKVHEWTTGPISLQNVKSIVIKTKNWLVKSPHYSMFCVKSI